VALQPSPGDPFPHPSERDAVTPRLGAVPTVRGGTPTPPPAGVDDGTRNATDELIELIVGSLRVVIGSLVALSAVTAGIVRQTLDPERRSPGESQEPPLAALVAGAALGATLDAAAVGARILRGGWTAVRWGAWIVPAPGARDAARRLAERWNTRWQEEGERSQDASTTFVQALVPQVVESLLDQVDLTAVVRERLDLDALVSTVDLDAIAGSIDLDRIVERLDVDAIAARIDPDAIVDRVDLERAVARIDVAAIAREVIEELDLLSLIRESSESVTSEAVDDLRLGAVDADRTVARIVDRIIRRHAPRSSEPVPGLADDPSP
jgi:hypothetical protein